MVLSILITLALVVLVLLVSSLHLSLRDYSVIKFEAIAATRGGRAAARVERLLDDVDGSVLAMGFLRVACNVALTLSVIAAFGVFHVEALPHAPAALPAAGIEGAEPAGHVVVSFPRLAMAFVTASLLVYLFGTAIPTSIAEHVGERILYTCAPLVRAIHVLAAPIRVVGLIDGAIRRIVGVHGVTEQQEIEAEILSVVSEGEREGSIGETEREMIESVVEFRQLAARDVMTPRTEIQGLELTNDLKVIREFVNRSGHSRIPVFMGDLDHVVGMLYAKDLLRYIGSDGAGFELKPLLRPAVFVPESKQLSELLRELRARKVHLAIVIDEHGGTMGIVSFEDILEEIVGDIQDEYEPAQSDQPDIVVNPETRSAEIEARAYIEDVNEALAVLNIKIPESDNYDTAGGYVLEALGHIPMPGESFATDAYTVTVLDAETTRVTRLRIEARVPQEASPVQEDLSDSKNAAAAANAPSVPTAAK